MEITVNGLRVSYDLAGEGETVVLIHGLGMDKGVWWQQWDPLTAKYRVLRYDVRGHGASDVPPGPYSLRLFADDLIALCDALGIASAHLVGVSMGGMIAQTAALVAPERVRSLVLCDTSSSYVGEASRVFEERADLVEREGMGPIVLPTLERWLTARYRAAHSDLVDRVAVTLRNTDDNGYVAACRAVGALALGDQISRIDCPTLVIVGAEDKSTPPEMAREIASKIKGARLEIIPEAAHLVPVEAAEQFNALVLSFLEEVVQQSGR